MATPASGQFIEPAARPHPGTADVGTRKELFVDDALIDQASGLSKVVTRPEKFIDNPVLRPDRPWEPRLGEKGAHGVGLAGQSVLYDPDERCFKMWYLCSGPPGRSFWCYATSADGLRWDKPELGRPLEPAGSRRLRQQRSLGEHADHLRSSRVQDAADDHPDRRPTGAEQHE
jgi:hypothetical protein